MITKKLIKMLPKTDLHVHLDGSLRLSTLLELAKERKVKLPAYTEAGLKEQVFRTKYDNLGEYLKGFAYTVAVMQDAEALERVAYELAEDNMAEGVRYIEVRFAPYLHTNDKLDAVEVLKAVNRGLYKAKRRFNRRKAITQKREPPFEYGIIVCAMRNFGKGHSQFYDDILRVHSFTQKKQVVAQASLELAQAAVEVRNRHNLPIVGFDLAGEEFGYPAIDHKEAFDYVHKNFMKKTVHAGEAYGPESIFQAITDCHADRIGHGTYLFATDKVKDPAVRTKAQKQKYVKDLAQYIADRRVTIEVCLTSNMQTTPAISDLSLHPFKQMREARLSTTFCTDNRLVSSTTVTDEVHMAVKAFNLSDNDLKNIIIYGFKRSFFPLSYLEKRRYVRHIIDYYDYVMGVFRRKEQGLQ